jgi:hypothetical protein
MRRHTTPRLCLSRKNGLVLINLRVIYVLALTRAKEKVVLNLEDV